MKLIVLCLFLFPLLASAISILRMITAKKLAVDECLKNKKIDENKIRTKFLTLCYLLSSCVFYGAVQMYMIYTVFGGFDAAEGIKLVCIITFVCTGISSIIKGIIGERGIMDGALFDEEKYKNIVLKMALAEIISVAGFIYFSMSCSGVI